MHIVYANYLAFFSKDNREKPAVGKSDQFRQLKLYKTTFTGKCSTAIISLYLFNIPFHVCRDDIKSFFHTLNLRCEIRLLSNRTPGFLFRIEASQKEISCPVKSLFSLFLIHDIAFGYLKKFPWQFHHWVTASGIKA